MIRVPFNRPFATREEIDYIRAPIATPKFCFTASCVLRAQLEYRDQIQLMRPQIWEIYVRELASWAEANGVRLPIMPAECEQSYHMFYVIMPSSESRQALISHLASFGILAVFHYLPLHLSPMGLRFGGRQGDCPVTEDLADRLLRLPFFTGMSSSEQSEVIEAVRGFRC